MKKLALIALAFLTLNTTNVFAGSNAFDDGSPKNTYIFGENLGLVKLDNVLNPDDFYQNDHTMINDYYWGRLLNSPLVSSHPLMDNPHNFGDGSPEY